MENSFLQDSSIIASTRLITFICHLIAKANGVSKERTITIVFRYDDYSDLYPINIEQNIIDALTKYHFPCTFGVIPYIGKPNDASTPASSGLQLSAQKIEFLKTARDSGLINIALHGYSHEDINDNTKQWFTEFSGLDYTTQLEKISKGKHFLEETLGVKVNTFIPPWNTYDQKTISALEHLDFECLSADIHGVVNSDTCLKFLPATVGPYELKLAIEKARMLPDIFPLIVALIHPYDFWEIGIFGLDGFGQLLNWIVQQKDVQVHSMEQVMQGDLDLSPDHFATYKASLSRSRVSPSFLHLPLHGVYPSIPAINRMNNLSRLLTSLFYLLILLISMGVTSLLEDLIYSVFPAVVLYSQVGLTAILVGLSLYALRNLALGVKGSVVVTTTIGAILGIWIANF
jgi:peptidoglycan/xylan/chitin deacetylase (PgdA/CDA1 family)